MLLKIMISTGLCALLVFTTSYQYQRSSSSENDQTSDLGAHNRLDSTLEDSTTKTPWSAEIVKIIKTLKVHYSKNIHRIHIQAQLITARQPIINALPAPINENLKAVLASAFPGHENSILNVWLRMDEYEHWLSTQNRTLMELNAISRSGMLWEKRNQLFPIAAVDIWSKEQDNYETAQLKFHDDLDELDQAHGLPMLERVQRLQHSFAQADNVFTQTLDQQGDMHINTIASVLFGLTSVQRDLQQLSPAQRQREIDSIRRELGFDENIIVKMSNLDEKREQRWKIGYAYMESRDELLASNEQVSPNQLNELRHQFFGKSAATIEREETNGFYRFQRPRYYGRN